MEQSVSMERSTDFTRQLRLLSDRGWVLTKALTLTLAEISGRNMAGCETTRMAAHRSTRRVNGPVVIHYVSQYHSVSSTPQSDQEEPQDARANDELLEDIIERFNQTVASGCIAAAALSFTSSNNSHK
eukprot:scaffold400010_cov40-Prasinocladus_malaysianus.AAC.1